MSIMSIFEGKGRCCIYGDVIQLPFFGALGWRGVFNCSDHLYFLFFFPFSGKGLGGMDHQTIG